MTNTLIIKPNWNPKKGSIYKVINKNGHAINSLSKAPFSEKYLFKYINKNDLFLFLGKQESIPEHYSFYQILFGDKVMWMSYPWRQYHNNDKIDFPIKLI